MLVVDGYFPVIVAFFEAVTAVVVIVNAVLDCCAGIVTLAGTTASAWLLVRVTDAPPGGARPLRVSEHRDVFPYPETRIDGFRTTEVSAAALTVSVLDLVVVPRVPDMETVPLAATPLVVTVKVAVVAPWGTTTEAGTVALFVSALARVTVFPPAGALEDKVTVPVAGLPPTTVAGLSETELRLWARHGGAQKTSRAAIEKKAARKEDRREPAAGR